MIVVFCWYRSHGFLNFKDLSDDAGAAFKNSLDVMKGVMGSISRMDPLYENRKHPDELIENTSPRV